MRETIPYLTDEELDRFIREMETEELVLAPPDILDDILEKVQQERVHRREKIIAYRKYRFRVLATVAAAVFVILVLPGVENVLQGRKEAQEVPLLEKTKVTWIDEDSLPGTENSAIMEKWFGGTTIFGNEDKYKLFR